MAASSTTTWVKGYSGPPSETATPAAPNAEPQAGPAPNPASRDDAVTGSVVTGSVATGSVATGSVVTGSVATGSVVRRSITALARSIGDETVAYPPGDDPGERMTRCEALLRVLWTRATLDGDATMIKLLLEHLTGKASDEGDASGQPTLHAEDMASAEALLRKVLDNDTTG